MEPNSKRYSFGNFVKNQKRPVIAALAAGLYPLFFYYTNNFSLVNSWRHFAFFVSLFLILPITVFVMVHLFRKRLSISLQERIIPFLNVLSILMFLQLCLFANIHLLLTIGVVLIAVLVSYFLHKHFKKIIVLELVLAVLAVFWLVPTIINQFNQNTEWISQPDDIESVVFKKRPNIYYIQPDGYVNFSELSKGYYNFNNDAFESFLAAKDFKFYEDFRTNYGSTLLSNTSIFMMKHHYFNMNATASGDPVDARRIIVSENSVLKAFQNNNYKTHLISEKPYFLVSRPELGYDYSNFSADDVALVSTGLNVYKDVVPPLEQYIDNHKTSNNFFFVQIFQPGHITSRLFDSKGVEGERKLYLDEVKLANTKLVRMVETIVAKDPEAMIIIMADHGGYVGFDHTRAMWNRTDDRDLVHSIFSSVMAVRWPNNEPPTLDKHFKSSVNMFRILFSYLSEDERYLDQLQDDASFVYIKEFITRGAYQYIDGQGKVTFKKFKGN
ncbi:MAG: hypothetical protein AAF489_08155 [Bacteroidota bacterium]